MKTKRRTDEPEHSHPLRAASPAEARTMFGAGDDPADRASLQRELGRNLAVQHYDPSTLPYELRRSD